ncbi:hypothetical protein DFH07DRAFT_973918 [Mycena maculata]|uniref:DUF5648 domain-containing protein n=1 Tax=Mycena maculata TaxID=230809 RepID=A0AAD7HBZ8_9AGAR|nr:hypothetical protein DFH07DRAFT_973918 [Mycena maculata]
MSVLAIFLIAVMATSSALAIRADALAIRGDKSKCPPPSKAVRSYQNDIENYRLTTRSPEKSLVIGNGYEFDGVAARVFETENTFDKGERDVALNDPANVEKGIAAHVFTRRVCGSKPLYRIYSPMNKAHFYILDENEVDEAISDKGYGEPVISGFVLPK